MNQLKKFYVPVSHDQKFFDQMEKENLWQYVGKVYFDLPGLNLPSIVYKPEKIEIEQNIKNLSKIPNHVIKSFAMNRIYDGVFKEELFINEVNLLIKLNSQHLLDELIISDFEFYRKLVKINNRLADIPVTVSLNYSMYRNLKQLEKYLLEFNNFKTIIFKKESVLDNKIFNEFKNFANKHNLKTSVVINNWCRYECPFIIYDIKSPTIFCRENETETEGIYRIIRGGNIHRDSKRFKFLFDSVDYIKLAGRKTVANSDLNICETLKYYLGFENYDRTRGITLNKYLCYDGPDKEELDYKINCGWNCENCNKCENLTNRIINEK